MRIDFNQEQGIWIAIATYEERHALKAAGFWWHDRGSCRYSGCKACAAGVHKQWWTFKADVANRVSGAATGQAQQALTGHRKALEESKAVEATLDIPCPDGLAYMPFQKAGIEFASKRANTLLADDMGLGKSIQAIGLINLKKYTKILIVCPASLRINWQREAEKWLVDKTLKIKVVLDGSVDGLDSNIVIVNFDRLKDEVLATLMGQTWDLLVVDECHACKNTKAQRTTKVLGSYNRQTKSKAPGLVDRARNKLFLTGTPILNRPIEIQPIAGALAPNLFGNFFAFAKKFADAVQTKYGWDFTGASNLDELQEKLRSSIMIRRKKADVLTDLPPKTRQIVVLPTNGATKAVQAEMWQGEDLDDLHADAEVALTSEDTAAYAAAVRRLDAAIKIAFEDMSEVRHNTAVAKIPAVLEHVRDVLDGGVAKVVVFAHHKDVIEALAKEFGASAVVLDGSTPNEMRQLAVDRFQNDPTVQVFIGSIRAAGVGITLTAASHVIFAELDWVPGWVTQSEDRCHRISQRNHVLIQHLVLDGSIDAKLANILVWKQQIIDSALDKDAPKIEVNYTESEQVALPKPKHSYPVATPEQRAACAAGLHALLSVCDGAWKQDGCGFNRFDATIGRKLGAVSLVRELTDGEVFLCKKILPKYKGQLGEELVGKMFG